MAINFPSSPVDGDLYSAVGRTWQYDAAASAWKSISEGNVTTTGLGIPNHENISVDSSGNTVLSGNFTPDTNITYDLGSASNRWRDLYLSGNSIELGSRTITADNVPEVDLAIAPEVLEIQVSAPAAGQATSWLWTWEQSTLPYARRTITNSPEVSVPLYKQGTYTINNYAAYDLFDSMTQTHSLYIKWVDGAGTDNLVSWATSTGPVSDSHPDINGGTTTDVQRISISVPTTITLPTLTAPSVSYSVTNNGSGAYTFSGSAAGDNPNLGPFYRGGTYTINITATGHPFYFTTDNGTNFSAGAYFGEYTDGVTGSRTDNGTITFTVPSDAPDTLYYQCGNHSSMRGAITIKDLAVEVNNNGNYVIYAQHTQEGHKTPIELRPIPSLVNQMCLVYDASVNKFVPQDLATYVENTPSFENKIREVAGTAELVVEDGSAVVAKVNVYDDSTYLPLVGNNAGDQAFATDVNTLFIWDGTTWETTKQRDTETNTTIDTYLASGSATSLTTTGDVTVGGNLTVNGTTTTINSTTLSVDDLNITLASGAADAASADGAGITVDGANASLTYNSLFNSWKFDRELRFPNNQGIFWDVAAGGASIGLKVDANDTITFRTGGNWDRVVINDSGNVGIGTNSPGSRLVVTGGIDTSTDWWTNAQALIRLQNGNSNGNPVLKFEDTIGRIVYGGATTSDKLIISSRHATNDAGKAVSINSSGFVGIGTDNPSVALSIHGETLHLYNADNNNNTFLIAENTGIGNAGLRLSNAQGTWTFIANDRLRLIDADSGGVERLSVASTGNIGIGTTDPSQRLVVDHSGHGVGLGYVSSIPSSPGGLYSTAGGSSYPFNEYGNLILKTRTDYNVYDIIMMTAATNGVPEIRMVVKDNGRVGVGTTNPTQDFEVQGSIGTNQVRHPVNPSFSVDFANSRELDSRISFYRDSIATYYDVDGLLKVANVNEPRFEYDPDTGESKGLLIEEARTNYTPMSQHIHSSPWGASGGVMVKANAGVAPDGTYSATRIQFSAASQSYSVNNGANWNSGNIVTTSMWVKGTAGEIINMASGGIDSYHTLTGEWQRIVNTATAVNTLTNVNSYGSSTARDFLIWGAQAEPYKHFASSYIPNIPVFMSRNSKASYHDENGVLRQASPNTPRYGHKYDGRRWVPTGLIVERSGSTNKITNNTQNISGEYKVGGLENASLRAQHDANLETTTAPDGSTVPILKSTGVAGGLYFYPTGTASTISGTNSAFSVYFKRPVTPNGYNPRWFQVYMHTNRFPAYSYFVYDIENDEIASTPTGNFWTSYDIEKVGNGWYRMSLAGTPNSTGVAFSFVCNFSNVSSLGSDGSAATTDFSGDPGKKYGYIWGAQMEDKSYASSFIPTSNSITERAADVISERTLTRKQDVAQVHDISWHNPNESTIYGEGTSITGNNDVGSNPALWGLTDGTSANRYILRRHDNDTTNDSTYSGFTFRMQQTDPDGTVYNNDYFPVTSVLPEWDDAGVHKMAQSISPGSQIGAADGIDAQMPSIASPVFDTPTVAQIGYAGSSAAWNGHIRKIAYYPEQLTIEQLKALTEKD